MNNIHYVYAADHLTAYVPGDRSGKMERFWIPPKLRAHARRLTRHQLRNKEALARLMDNLDALEQKRNEDD